MDFLSAMIDIIIKVFTDYIPAAAKAVVSMFGGLFWTPGVGDAAGSVTILGAFGLGILGIALVGSLLRMVMSFIPHKMKKSF